MLWGSRTVPWVVQWDERPTYSLWHPHRNAFHQLCPKSQQLAAKRRCPDFLASRDAVYKNYCTWHGGKPCKIMQNSCTCCIVHQPAYPKFVSWNPDSGLEKGWIRMRIRICCAAHLNVHEALRQHSTAALRAAIFGAAMSVPCSRQRKEWHATKEWDAPGGVRDTTRWPNPNLGWKCDKID